MEDSPSRAEAVRTIQAFNALPLERRLEIFRSLSAKAREELVQTVAQPEEIIRLVSEEEMFFTVKDLGAESAAGLIALTTGKQLTYFLDIELWMKDMFRAGSAARWLQILSAIGDQKLLQFVQTTDPDLLLAILRRFLKVKVRNPDVDLVEQHDELPPFTLDDVFFVDFRNSDSDEVFKQLLETVFAWNTRYYFSLMEDLAFGFTSENEEAALKWRKARLADKGFPDFDEALEIYQYLHRSTMNPPASPGEDCPSPASDDADRILLGYPLKMATQDTLFRKSVDCLDHGTEQDRLSRELAHLANKVMVADGRDPGLIDDLYGSLRKVSGYINLALEECCGDDVQMAAGMLRANHMEILFRRGFSLILNLRKEAQKLVRESEGGMENLGHPLASLLKGLMLKRPLYDGTHMEHDKLREFEYLQDIETIRRMLDRTALEESWESI